MMRNDCFLSGTSFRTSRLIDSAVLRLRRRGSHYPVLLVIWGLFVFPLNTRAQDAGGNIQHTQNKPDQTLRSQARVDPSTHGMSIQIPLGMLPGRAGVNVPVSITYSSKVWRLGDADTKGGGSGHLIAETEIRTIYAEHSVSGWTTSISMPRIELSYIEQAYDNFGDSDAGDGSGNVKFVARINIHMTDGSTHELRKDDIPRDSPAGFDSGKYYAVDSSQMLYNADEKVLYLPDGSRYLNFMPYGDGTIQATQYIDRNGNTLNYNISTRVMTDTLGRAISSPLPGIPPGGTTVSPNDYQYTLPGVNGAPLVYTFKWDYLVDPVTGHSVLSDPVTLNQLSFPGDQDCTQNFDYPAQSPYLFAHIGRSRICGLDISGGTSNARINPVVLSEVLLPNGTSYRFTYNRYGEIDGIEYPTGGYERFVYGYVKPMTYLQIPYDKANRGVIDRFVSAGGPNDDEAHWQYDVTYNTDTHGPYLVSMTSPDGTINKQILYAHPEHYEPPYESAPFGFDEALLGRAYDEQVYRPDQAMLRRKLTQWAVDTTTVTVTINPYRGETRTFTVTRNPRVSKVVEILLDTGGNALAATTTMQYDPDLNLSVTSQYDYKEVIDSTGNVPRSGTIDQMPQGTLLRTTGTTYLVNDANVPERESYRARNLIALPTSMRVEDGAGALVAETKMKYDQTTPFTYSAVTGWTNPGTSYRGNLTSTQSWRHYPGETDTYLATGAKYDQCGSVRETTDARQNKSTILYSSAYNLYAYPEQMTSPDPDGAGSATALVTTSAYDTNNQTGLLLSATDANNQTTYFHYDNFNRLQTETRPAGGGETTYIYGDQEPDLFVKSQTRIDASRVAESIQYFDGLGRPVRALMAEGQGSYTATETKYDVMGRIHQVSNPYRTTATGPGYQASIWTTTSYDNLGRVTKVQTEDEAEVLTVYDGQKVTVTDQDGKDRRSTTDALGRLTDVVEDPGGLNYSTSYTYDALDNLTRVEQGPQGQQVRIFKYDSLKRLRSAQNPESGTITYEYDANGNLIEKKDARNLLITYSYDNLNRLTLRHYSDATPEVIYTYDQTGVVNSKGRLTSVITGSGTIPVSKTSYTGYDAMGRVTASTQTTAAKPFPMSYEYDQAGNLTAQTYPSGRKVRTDYDGAARISQVEGEQDGVSKTYASSFGYAAHGAIEQMKLGNGLWEHVKYDPKRLQPTEIGLGTTQGGVDRLKLTYNYGTSNNNGNVRRQVMTVPNVAGAGALTVTQHYEYDELNRLKKAQEVSGGTSTAWQASFTWQQSYAYDCYGNRTSVNSVVTGGQLSLPTYEPAPAVDPLTNRYKEEVNSQPTGFDYDASGNLTQERREANSAALMSYTYDGENRMVQAKQGTQVFGTYTYDGDGRRVKKVVGERETIFVYSIMGQLVAEYDNEAQGGGGTSYITADHLGSTRLVTDQGKAVVARHDYLPYGEEIATLIGGRTAGQGYDGDDPRQKFTGKERDDETGLDFFGARYYASVQGRFTSPDPVAGLTRNPQSLNAYSYVWNNPLKLTDPTGMTVEWEDSKKEKMKGETEPRTQAQRKYENRIAELLNSNNAKERARGERLQATYQKLKDSKDTFHVVNDDAKGASSGELEYRGQGNFYVNLKGDSRQTGALSDLQRIAHEFKHGEQVLDGQLGYMKYTLEGEQSSYKLDRYDEAEAFAAGADAEGFSPAQRSNPFLNDVANALPRGEDAVVNALGRGGSAYQQLPSERRDINPADLKTYPSLHAVPSQRKY